MILYTHSTIFYNVHPSVHREDGGIVSTHHHYPPPPPKTYLSTYIHIYPIVHVTPRHMPRTTRPTCTYVQVQYSIRKEGTNEPNRSMESEEVKSVLPCLHACLHACLRRVCVCVLAAGVRACWLGGRMDGWTKTLPDILPCVCVRARVFDSPVLCSFLLPPRSDFWVPFSLCVCV